MSYVASLDAIAQTYIPNGTPLDEAASTLGIIAMSLDPFPGIAMAPGSPSPPADEVEDELA